MKNVSITDENVPAAISPPGALSRLAASIVVLMPPNISPICEANRVACAMGLARSSGMSVRVRNWESVVRTFFIEAKISSGLTMLALSIFSRGSNAALSALPCPFHVLGYLLRLLVHVLLPGRGRGCELGSSQP